MQTVNTQLKIHDPNVSSIQAHKSVSSMNQNFSDSLLSEISGLDIPDVVEKIKECDPNTSAMVLRSLGPRAAGEILEALPDENKSLILDSAIPELKKQWLYNLNLPQDSVGKLMEPVWAVFSPDVSVDHAVSELREIVKREFITYAYVIDRHSRLLGVVVMRDLLFAEPSQSLSEIMLKNPFSLKANTSLMDAMREVLVRHFPVYPVTDDSGVLVGLIRGHRLFEAQAIEISAQAGSMVGVEKEEKLSTPWTRSFKYRHPWLQLNLLTAFVAGAVVSVFQDTINQLVVLASFLPVLAGQSGNTGCQALAVTIRGMTLRELDKKGIPKLLFKEGLLGLLNGAFVGVSAAAGMFFLATSQGNPMAWQLSTIVFFAMIGSCFISGLSGALVPLALKRLGADPATASSIFLTTATDVASMGMLLTLATWFLL